MTSKLFVHVPLAQLPDRIDQLTTQKLQPEIACHEVNLLDLNPAEFRDYAQQLQENGLVTTLHAPFSGFSCGSLRRKINDHSHRIVEQTLKLAEVLQACRIVFHPGLDFASSERRQQQWLELSIPFWQGYLKQAEEQNTILCLENIWETRFEYQLMLLQELDTGWFGHVFDIGHCHLFSEVPLSDWLSNLGPYIKHLHIHDNNGRSDDHLVLAEGNAPLTELFQWLTRQQNLPTVTLENRHLEQALLSLRYLAAEQPELLHRLNPA